MIPMWRGKLMPAFETLPKAKQIERWEQAIRVLREMTRHERREHFDMSTWGVSTSCGTVACAGGRCGQDPWFRRRGFGMDLKRFYAGGNRFTCSPSRFFGYEGTDRIFLNSTPRPVGKVIREMRTFVRELKRS